MTGLASGSGSESGSESGSGGVGGLLTGITGELVRQNYSLVRERLFFTFTPYHHTYSTNQPVNQR